MATSPCSAPPVTGRPASTSSACDERSRVGQAGSPAYLAQELRRLADANAALRGLYDDLLVENGRLKSEIARLTLSCREPACRELVDAVERGVERPGIVQAGEAEGPLEWEVVKYG